MAGTPVPLLQEGGLRLRAARGQTQGQRQVGPESEAGLPDCGVCDPRPEPSVPWPRAPIRLLTHWPAFNASCLPGSLRRARPPSPCHAPGLGLWAAIPLYPSPISRTLKHRGRLTPRSCGERGLEQAPERRLASKTRGTDSPGTRHHPNFRGKVRHSAPQLAFISVLTSDCVSQSCS